MKPVYKIAAVAAFALAAVLPAKLAAQDLRGSVSLLGGVGEYEYRIHPDAGSVLIYDAMTAGIPSASVSPLRTLADMESYSPLVVEGNASLGRLEFEYLFLDSKSIGLTFGLSYASYTEECIENCGTYTTLMLLNSMSSSADPFSQLLFANLVLSRGGYDYSLTTMDIGLNYHILPDARIDPYIGVNVGVGVCSISGSETGTICTGAKYGGRVGARIYFTPAVFMTLQAEMDRIELSVASPSGGGLAVQPVPSKQYLVGIGVRS